MRFSWNKKLHHLLVLIQICQICTYSQASSSSSGSTEHIINDSRGTVSNEKADALESSSSSDSIDCTDTTSILPSDTSTSSPEYTQLSSLRCGGIPIAIPIENDTTESEQIILEYLQQQEHQLNPTKDPTANPKSATTLSTLSTSEQPKFHIQGWRWHTLSLLRDSARLEQLCNRFLQSTPSTNINSNTNENTITSQDKNTYTDTESINESLTKAVHHVMDFNLKGLQRIEETLFFPWMRDKLIKATTPSTINGNTNGKIQNAFETILDAVDQDRQTANTISQQLQQHLQSITSTSTSTPTSSSTPLTAEQRTQILSNMSSLTSTFKSLTQSIYNRENTLLVPALSYLVPESEQKSFNNKVLRKLGLFESRVHLVGMYEAVWDDLYGNEKERKLFEEAIPKIPRMMISRWKRTLYDPQAGILDEA